MASEAGESSGLYSSLVKWVRRELKFHPIDLLVILKIEIKRCYMCMYVSNKQLVCGITGLHIC